MRMLWVQLLWITLVWASQIHYVRKLNSMGSGMGPVLSVWLSHHCIHQELRFHITGSGPPSGPDALDHTFSVLRKSGSYQVAHSS
ncbi:hypothetical protein TNCT_268911 [Trichonephila clavata]|uniref:Secreted protein n=1 Tax=Trichonephila clavata TaxID=2740835 RepID=A0A8X6I0Y7_TRICU|nr:hypothetical protein TNCT_268911 [Trichonephila clavata]